MDEPFGSGALTPECGGPDLGPTFGRLQRYFANVRFAAPAVEIGLIEPYPTFSADQLLAIVREMAARGIRPAFFHLDADLNQLKKGSDPYPQDLRTLDDGLRAMGVRFGIIFWGHSGDSDALYYGDAMDLIRRTRDAMPALLHDLPGEG